MRRCLRDPMFSRFYTIPECDGHTHTDTRRRHIPRLARRRAVKMDCMCMQVDPEPNFFSANGWLDKIYGKCIGNCTRVSTFSAKFTSFNNLAQWTTSKNTGNLCNWTLSSYNDISVPCWRQMAAAIAIFVDCCFLSRYYTKHHSAVHSQ